MISFSGPPPSTSLGRKKTTRMGATLLPVAGLALAVGTGPRPGHRPQPTPARTASLPGTVPLRAASLPGSSAGKPAKSEFEQRIALEYPRLDALYKHLHRFPELSLQEGRTAARLAHELEGTGFEVTHNFGGFGLVAVLHNGHGPTVLVRT